MQRIKGKAIDAGILIIGRYPHKSITEENDNQIINAILFLHILVLGLLIPFSFPTIIPLASFHIVGWVFYSMFAILYFRSRKGFISYVPEIIVASYFVITVLYLIVERSLNSPSIYLLIMVSTSISLFVRKLKVSSFTFIANMALLVFFTIVGFEFDDEKILLWIGLMIILILNYLHFEYRNNRMQQTATNQIKQLGRDYKLIFNHSPVGIALAVAETGEIIIANDAYMEMLGYSSEELKTISLHQITHPEDLPYNIKQINEIRTGQSDRIEYRKRYRNSAGVYFWVQVTVTLLSGNHREGEEDRLIAIVEDINDVVIKEEQIKESNKLVQQMSKMDALARFAGGISHDYKNLLTAIVGNLDLLLVNSDQTIEQHKEDIYKIKEICYQGAEFVKQLVRFSQNETGSIGIIELNSFLKTKASFYRTLLGEHIKLTFEETTEKLPILIDISDIDQILLNLIVNAKDAMKDGGKLQIMTKRCSSISDDIYASTILSGSTEHLHAQYYVHIEVEDNGKGIDANSLDQIFEPYFSMKENGSGLGLSIVFSVVKKYGGTITVKSDLGIGTKFVIHLPMAENRDDMNLLVERQLKSEEMELDLGEFKNLKNKMILVIEDDERITSVLSKAFDKMKLTYFITKNEEEIHALGNILSEVSIIISDVLIEGGVGTDSVKDILLQNPTAEVLIISGYISRGDLGEMLALDNVSFLSKPFSIEEIIERIDLIAEKLN